MAISTDRVANLNYGAAIKVPVKVATTGSITLAGAQTIDGVAVTLGDRVLVKNQSTASQNGIYDVTLGAWSRSVDFDGQNDIVEGTLVYVSQGTVNGGRAYRVSTTSPAIGSSLSFALANGADTAFFTQSGTGAVTRSVQTKLRDTVSVEDFGAVGDGATDDTTAFTNALAAAKTVLAHKGPYLIDNNLTIPAHTALVGPLRNPGQILPYTSANYQALPGSIILNGAKTITPSHGSSVSGFRIIRKGLTLPFANATAATAGIAAFTGDVFTFSAQDVHLSDLMVLGFSWVVQGNGERSLIQNIRSDCTNGISLQGVGDIARVENCHAYPFTTAQASFVTDALQQRSGQAFLYANVADWCRWTNCVAFGYDVGFDIYNADNVQAVNCAVDGNGTIKPGSLGYRVQGVARETLFLGCQAAQQEFGWTYQYSGGATGERVIMQLVGCSSWGIENAHVYSIAGCVMVSDCKMRAGGYGSASALTADPTNGFIFANGNRFDAFTAPISIFGTAASRSRIGANNHFPNCTNKAYEAPVRLDFAYTAPVTGNTITAPDLCGQLIIEPSGALAALTIEFPANPTDGQEFEFFTTQSITALTCSATGKTITTPATAANPYDWWKYIYRAANTTWYLKGLR